MMFGAGPGESLATRPLPGETPGDTPAPITARGRNATAFESVAVGDRLPPRSVALTLGDLVNYAGASGDPNPIHWSPTVAALVGLVGPENGVVAHGMLSMGLGAGFVTSWLGDPGAVLDYGVRFTSPVYVTVDRPGDIEYTGKVKSLDPSARTAVIAVTASHQGKKIFGRAIATVQLG
jgi:acyl dehydratase